MARANRDCGQLPLPKGEGWGEGLQTIERSEPPHPNPLPVGERESRRAVVAVRARLQNLRHHELRCLTSDLDVGRHCVITQENAARGRSRDHDLFSLCWCGLCWCRLCWCRL